MRFGSVEWDRRFRFLPPVLTSLSAEEEALASAVGASFMCGREMCNITYLNNGYIQSFSVNRNMVQKGHRKENVHLVVCGPDVEDPRNFEEIDLPFSVRICPLTQRLPDFGMVVSQLMSEGLDRPRVDLFYEDVLRDLPNNSVECDDRLGSDSCGKMARYLADGGTALNHLMRGPCYSWFHGRILGKKRWGDPVCLMLPHVAKYYFPNESHSKVLFAAAWMPVRVRVTDRFREDFDTDCDEIDLAVSSEYVPEISTFLRFCEIFGLKCVWSSSPHFLIPQSIPVFQKSGVYNVTGSRYREILDEFDRIL